MIFRKTHLLTILSKNLNWNSLWQCWYVNNPDLLIFLIQWLKLTFCEKATKCFTKSHYLFFKWWSRLWERFCKILWPSQNELWTLEKNTHILHCTVHSGAFKRSISKCGSWLDAKARYLLSLKSNLINAHRDALKANHLSVNSVAGKKGK